MNWEIREKGELPYKQNITRDKEKFAWKPTRLNSKESPNTMVWLETYWITQRFTVFPFEPRTGLRKLFARTYGWVEEPNSRRESIWWREEVEARHAGRY